MKKSRPSVATLEEEQRPLLSIQADDSDFITREEEAAAGDRRKSRDDSRRNSGDASPDRRKSRDDSNKIRRPVQYYTINTEGSPGPIHHSHHDDDTVASVSRYKYYNKLTPHSEGRLHMPDHVVPAAFFSQILVPVTGKQGSLITIFALWNTMMGTSLLSMPWAIRQAGFTMGLVLIVAMAGLMLYTSYRVMLSIHGIDLQGEVLEFSDVCRFYLGRWVEMISIVCSLVTLLGGMVIYWILMSNFLYNDVKFVYNQVHKDANSSSAQTPVNYTQYGDVYCPHPPTTPFYNMSPSSNTTVYTGEGTLLAISSQTAAFNKVWDKEETVPFFLILILGPLLNFKSPTFFTKFNMLGTVSVAYVMSFVTAKAARWGFHLDFSSDVSELHVPQFRDTFPALTGVAALAYFIHNCVLSVVRNQKHPEHNIRDLTIAYILVCVTYFYVGFMMYSAFPLSKDCIEDNLLNNFRSDDVLAFVARICLFVQMTAVFPLLMYIFRVQVMHALFGTVWPGIKPVLLLNLVLIGICVVFARFLPHIGPIISFVGAFCGFAYAIALPCIVYMLSLRAKGELTYLAVIVHSTLIIFGLANFVAQFMILGKT